MGPSFSAAFFSAAFLEPFFTAAFVTGAFVRREPSMLPEWEWERRGVEVGEGGEGLAVDLVGVEAPELLGDEALDAAALQRGLAVGNPGRTMRATRPSGRVIEMSPPSVWTVTPVIPGPWLLCTATGTPSPAPRRGGGRTPAR